MSKASRQELERQMAAFVASGGQVTQVDEVDSPRMCEARYYNVTDKVMERKFGKHRGRYSGGKAKLLRSSRGNTLV